MIIELRPSIKYWEYATIGYSVRYEYLYMMVYIINEQWVSKWTLELKFYGDSSHNIFSKFAKFSFAVTAVMKVLYRPLILCTLMWAFADTSIVDGNSNDGKACYLRARRSMLDDTNRLLDLLRIHNILGTKFPPSLVTILSTDHKKLPRLVAL